jgi:hypothetical protein
MTLHPISFRAVISGCGAFFRHIMAEIPKIGVCNLLFIRCDGEFPTNEAHPIWLRQAMNKAILDYTNRHKGEHLPFNRFFEIHA